MLASFGQKLPTVRIMAVFLRSISYCEAPKKENGVLASTRDEPWYCALRVEQVELSGNTMESSAKTREVVHCYGTSI